METIPIEALIPQRDPVLMVDELLEASDDAATTSLTVRDDNFFLDEEGKLAETGLIEHIAQSASALAGYRALRSGAKEAPVGYIGEVKKFRCFRRPAQGEVLHTEIRQGAEVNGVAIVDGKVEVGGELVAQTQLKIYVKPD